jgi:hypothetical protein
MVDPLLPSIGLGGVPIEKNNSKVTVTGGGLPNGRRDRSVAVVNSGSGSLAVEPSDL